MLKYKCLILDHDDTAVDSTAEIHYPAHVEIMRQIRPTHIPVSLEQWFLKNYHPGIMEYLKDELKLTDSEMETEYEIWRDYTSTRTPGFYPGFLDVIHEFYRRGGIVTVVSHSDVDIIRSHYQMSKENGAVVPDTIFGWTSNADERKPHPFPINQILEKYQLEKHEVLVVDDLKPGVLMAKAAGVEIAGAGWGHRISEIETYMKANCLIYLRTIEEFRDLILN